MYVMYVHITYVIYTNFVFQSAIAAEFIFNQVSHLLWATAGL